MRFERTLAPDAAEVAAALGVPPGGPAPGGFEALAALLVDAARPRWAWVRLPLRLGGQVAAGPLALPGSDIRAHLAGCDACVLLAVTLGAGVDRLIAAQSAADVGGAVTLDAAASVLAEQYAEEAGRLVAEKEAADGLFVTGRFSPGYGDLPLALQADVLRLLNAQRGIGLVASPGGGLLPRKSVTAIVGVAGRPVAGRPAGCEHCALNGKCTYRREGRHCGRVTT